MKKENVDKKIGWTRLFYNNKFVAILSVLLAVTLWFINKSSNTEENPRAIAGVPIKITLSDSAQSDGMKVFSPTKSTVTVYVKGNNLIVNQLTPSDLVATVPSASTITSPATYTFPLEVHDSDANLTKTQYTVDSISPPSVAFTVDRYRE